MDNLLKPLLLTEAQVQKKVGRELETRYCFRKTILITFFTITYELILRYF